MAAKYGYSWIWRFNSNLSFLSLVNINMTQSLWSFRLVVNREKAHRKDNEVLKVKGLTIHEKNATIVDIYGKILKVDEVRDWVMGYIFALKKTADECRCVVINPRSPAYSAGCYLL